mgnify:FL=1|tara:strand:- start:327 stop:812 length:486 start_codon:yes stop_codon:yes gene_type:complete
MLKKIIISSFFLIFSQTSIIHSKPNYQVIHDALGFMLGGDYGWDNVATEYQIEGCMVSYVQDFMGLSLIAVYDFDKAFWNSASSQVGEDGREYFMLDGEIGLQEVYAYDEYGDDVTEGLWIWGINGGKGTLMTFPILVDISRFENAMYDLMDECPGIKSKY